MKALTLWRPWPWAILHGSKRVENRDGPPPLAILGRYIALHAGKAWDFGGAGLIRDFHPEMPDGYNKHPLGIVAIARVTGVRRSAHGDSVEAEQRRWFFGPCGWLFDDCIAIPAVACRGFQGLWQVPDAVCVEVMRAVRETVGYVATDRITREMAT
jgi:hypothetical protein